MLFMLLFVKVIEVLLISFSAPHQCCFVMQFSESDFYEVQRIGEDVQVWGQLLWKFVMFILDIMWNKQVLLQHDVS